MRCHNCKGESFESQAVKIVTKAGEHCVVSNATIAPVCTVCGQYTLDAKTASMVELNAAIVFLSDVTPVTGAILKFARKALGLTQPELAAQISASTESISRWERGERPAEPWVALALRGLVLAELHPRPAETELLRKAC